MDNMAYIHNTFNERHITLLEFFMTSFMILRWIKSFYLDPAFGAWHLTFQDFLERHLYFLTVRFRSTKNQLAGLEKLHFRISKSLLGNKLNRKRDLQPFMLGFVDVEGSRTGRVLDIRDSSGAHVHALTIVRPELTSKFDVALADITVTQLPPSQLRVTKFNSESGTIEKLLSYCMKGYVGTKAAYSGKEDLWGFFPK